MYSINGVKKDSYGDEPFLIASVFPKDKEITLQNRSEMLISGFESNGLSEREIINTSDNKINGYNAYKTVVKGKMKGVETIIYQLLIANHNKTISIQGVIKSEFEYNLSEMEKLANTIIIK